MSTKPGLRFMLRRRVIIIFLVLIALSSLTLRRVMSGQSNPGREKPARPTRIIDTKGTGYKTIVIEGPPPPDEPEVIVPVPVATPEPAAPAAPAVSVQPKVVETIPDTVVEEKKEEEQQEQKPLQDVQQPKEPAAAAAGIDIADLETTDLF